MHISMSSEADIGKERKTGGILAMLSKGITPAKGMCFENVCCYFVRTIFDSSA